MSQDNQAAAADPGSAPADAPAPAPAPDAPAAAAAPAASDAPAAADPPYDRSQSVEDRLFDLEEALFEKLLPRLVAVVGEL